MKKKILFMVSSMNIGGVEKSLLSLLSVIPKDKYDITVLTLEKKGGFLDYIPSYITVEETAWFKEIKPIIMESPQRTIKKYLKENKVFKIPIFIYSYYKSKNTDNRYIYYKNILKSIPENEGEYDVAIAYAGPTEIIDAYITHKVKAKKKIGWVHFDISKHKINEKLYENLYEKFDKIFTVSNEANKKLNEIIPSTVNKSEVLLNIISKELINEMAKEDINFDNEFNGIKIVTVGRLSKEKGQDLAIKALANLKKGGYKVRWYCVGEGNSREEYESLIKDNKLEEDFILLGATPNPYPYIKNSDIYVQTSRHEGYCLTLAEAKCLCKPIVTTNFTGAYEQIEHGINGLIVPLNEDYIYKNVKYIMDNKSVSYNFIEKLKIEAIDTRSNVNKLMSFID
ncbi:glycosyltransferase [uncultured Clostridium sp.]|uniref:glycosyltransferase n=1 Tax=uncultured Clostridium sp. TaxID=59620 RepID=UPI0025953AF9|nr:glycosyltransferase [uncultured Clostridium sp.]